MRSKNQVSLIGRLGQDPQQGNSVTSFSIATGYKKKDGNEVTQWHNCKAFGQLAEISAKFLKKGDLVAVDGSLDYSEHDGKRYTNIIVKDLIMLGNKKEDEPPF